MLCKEMMLSNNGLVDLIGEPRCIMYNLLDAALPPPSPLRPIPALDANLSIHYIFVNDCFSRKKASNRTFDVLQNFADAAKQYKRGNLV